MDEEMEEENYCLMTGIFCAKMQMDEWMPMDENVLHVPFEWKFGNFGWRAGGRNSWHLECAMCGQQEKRRKKTGKCVFGMQKGPLKIPDRKCVWE